MNEILEFRILDIHFTSLKGKIRLHKKFKGNDAIYLWMISHPRVENHPLVMWLVERISPLDGMGVKSTPTFECIPNIAPHK